MLEIEMLETEMLPASEVCHPISSLSSDQHSVEATQQLVDFVS